MQLELAERYFQEDYLYSSPSCSKKTCYRAVHPWTGWLLSGLPLWKCRVQHKLDSESCRNCGCYSVILLTIFCLFLAVLDFKTGGSFISTSLASDFYQQLQPWLDVIVAQGFFSQCLCSTRVIFLKVSSQAPVHYTATGKAQIFRLNLAFLIYLLSTSQGFNLDRAEKPHIALRYSLIRGYFLLISICINYYYY